LRYAVSRLTKGASKDEPDVWLFLHPGRSLGSSWREKHRSRAEQGLARSMVLDSTSYYAPAPPVLENGSPSSLGCPDAAREGRVWTYRCSKSGGKEGAFRKSALHASSVGHRSGISRFSVGRADLEKMGREGLVRSGTGPVSDVRGPVGFAGAQGVFVLPSLLSEGCRRGAIRKPWPWEASGYLLKLTGFGCRGDPVVIGSQRIFVPVRSPEHLLRP